MLEIKNLSAGYGTKTVLSDVSVTFQKGKLTTVVGVNGCGKSTLLKAILGILPPSRGQIIVDGNDISLMKREKIAKKIAYLSQGKNTPDMTVRQMVLHGRFPYLSYPRRYSDIDREIATVAMNDVGVLHLADKPLSTISGGMRQNAYIAMALAQNTDYILLDEPNTYLDVSHQLEMMKLLQRLAKSGKGIITVMHDLPFAFDFSDEIVVIANASVVAKATPRQLCNSAVIKELFGVAVTSGANGKYIYQY